MDDLLDKIPKGSLFDYVRAPLPGDGYLLPEELKKNMITDFGSIDLSAIRSASSVGRSCSLLVSVVLGALFSFVLYKVVKN